MNGHDRPRPEEQTPRAGAVVASPAPASPAPWIDSHAHIASEAFDADRDAVLQRSRESGAQGIICIGESLEAAARARGIAEANPSFVWWTAGVHPHDAAGFDPGRDVEAIAAALQAGAVAVGECGLDYHYDHSPRALQRRAFAAQLALGAQHDRAVVVHTREAEDDTIAMLREAGTAGIRGVLHCFTGSPALAEVGLEAGWYVSFAGIATFKKWERDDVVRRVPADRLLLESDSPYLAPVPNRGKRNEPAWCAHTLARLASVRGDDPVSLGRAVADNARTLFRLS
ncbi:MAG: TatD family hydrolase [Gemmatimonadaceae bacterium]|nr:TatD family hydrolase [Gemmatimonadaceae bacterium]